MRLAVRAVLLPRAKLKAQAALQPVLRVAASTTLHRVVAPPRTVHSCARCSASACWPGSAALACGMTACDSRSYSG